MTTRNPSRRFSPSLPSGKHIGIALASAAAGVVIGAAAVSQPFQSEDSTSTVASVSQASTNIVPGSAVTNDSVQPSTQERKLSPTGVNGHRDLDPDLVVPNAELAGVSASASEARKLSPNGTNGFRDFDPAVVTPNLVSSNEVRTLSPTGTNGFRDFDPSVTYPGSR